MSRCFREYDLERRPRPPFDQVATMRRRICFADHDVGVDLGLAIFNADVADERRACRKRPQRSDLRASVWTRFLQRQ